MTTTIITPTHTPALKILSMAWQLLHNTAITTIEAMIALKLNLSIIIDFTFIVIVSSDTHIPCLE